MAALRPRTTSVVIYQGDDLHRLAELRQAAETADRRVLLLEQDLAAPAPTSGRWDDGDEAAKVADPETLAAAKVDLQAARADYDAAVDEAAEDAIEVELQMIGRKAFRELVTAHPARTTTGADGQPTVLDEDAEYGVNVETFPRALLAFVFPGYEDVRTITGPETVTGRLERFLDVEVSDGDFERLWQTAYWLNRGEGVDPKETRYSTGSRSGASS